MRSSKITIAIGFLIGLAFVSPLINAGSMLEVKELLIKDIYYLIVLLLILLIVDTIEQTTTLSLRISQLRNKIKHNIQRIEEIKKEETQLKRPRGRPKKNG
jgi:hypothetical protein